MRFMKLLFSVLSLSKARSLFDFYVGALHRFVRTRFSDIPEKK